MHKEKKRLIIEIPYEFHKWIKQTATDKNQTITWWVIEALKDKQEKDKALGF